jgi:hypothetical protein
MVILFKAYKFTVFEAVYTIIGTEPDNIIFINRNTEHIIAAKAVSGRIGSPPETIEN